MVYNLVRKDYSAFDLSNQYNCIILSFDSIDKLAQIFPVNLYELSNGTAKDIPLLSNNLTLESYLKVILLDDRLFLLTPKDTYKVCINMIVRILEPKDFLDEFYNIYLIEGPSAINLVSDLVSEEVKSIQYHDSIFFGSDNNKNCNICLRCSFLGETGYLLFIKEIFGQNNNFLASLTLQSFDDPDVAVLVNEANTKVWNKSVFKNDCPIEIGLSHILDFEEDKFDFNLKLNNKRKSNQRRLIAIMFNSTDCTDFHKDIDNILYSCSENREVGICVRACYSNEMKCIIGFALIDIEYSYLGMKLFHNKYGRLKVHKTPFFITKSNAITE